VGRGTARRHAGTAADHAHHRLAGHRRQILASWIFLLLALALTFPVVITVNYLGSPDNGVIFAGYVGSFLMAGPTWPSVA
jgi:hypothetical protein